MNKSALAITASNEIFNEEKDKVGVTDQSYDFRQSKAFNKTKESFKKQAKMKRSSLKDEDESSDEFFDAEE
jgi:hypothetical protein